MEHFYIYDNAMTEETWSVKDAKESEYGKVISLMEEYGRVLAHDAEPSKIKGAKRKILKGGYDNPYFKKVANDEVVELMKWVDALSD